MRVDRIEIAFQGRLVQPSEIDRNVIKPTGCEAAIEVPQSGDGHANDRNLDIGAGVVKKEEIEARSVDNVDAGQHLFARVEMAELRAKTRLKGRVAIWGQIGVVFEPQWRNAVESRLVRLAAAHDADGKELVQLRQCAQQGD